ncbi:tRNA 4-thiouridine(8) synthase ThiI [Myxococcota bacterium]|nr:tRNA 4-thiouridine(8) synthase ThiI [Myxococcota bacterium]
MTTNVIAVRFGEVFLKGGKRAWFTRRLRESLERQVRQAGNWQVRELHDQFLLVHGDSRGLSGLRDFEVTEPLRQALQRTFGVASLHPGRLVSRDIETLEREVASLVEDHVAGRASFKVESSRADKEYPLDSMALNRRLGAVVFERCRVPVRLEDPEVVIRVHILPQGALISVGSEKGPGGLPVGTAGRVLLLLSGGIDSPVAGWQMMRRGCDLDAVHFEAAPWTRPEARDKVRVLSEFLASFQAGMRLFVVPFGAIQAHLRDHAPGPLLVVLYRRMMMRIASRLARRTGALALATGENLAQVASQTLPNLAVIEEAAEMPVLRPLLAFDKQETMALARRIGTYETSILPYEDCCSLFVPPHPETAASLDRVRAVEERVDPPILVDQAVGAAEEIRLGEAVTAR